MTHNRENSQTEPSSQAAPVESPLTRVEDIMTSEVVFVHPDATVSRIAQLMHEKAISGIPVVDEERRIVGLVTDLDLIVRNTRIDPPAFFPLLDGRIPLETASHFKKRIQHMVGSKARDVMTEEVLTVGPEEDIEALADLMVKRKVNPVPVVEGGRLVGIVARADVIRWMARDDDGPTPDQSS
ncbi:MAG: CBS domain-containing protein [Vicinamibacteria bacterium]|nr:CBS domain-containing protein [Vicinamibacteria bacterium]